MAFLVCFDRECHERRKKKCVVTPCNERHSRLLDHIFFIGFRPVWSHLKKKRRPVVPRDVACACKPYAALVHKSQHKSKHLELYVGKDIHNISPYTSSRLSAGCRAKTCAPCAQILIAAKTFEDGAVMSVYHKKLLYKPVWQVERNNCRTNCTSAKMR